VTFTSFSAVMGSYANFVGLCNFPDADKTLSLFFAPTFFGVSLVWADLPTKRPLADDPYVSLAVCRHLFVLPALPTKGNAIFPRVLGTSETRFSPPSNVPCPLSFFLKDFPVFFFFCIFCDRPSQHDQRADSFRFPDDPPSFFFPKNESPISYCEGFFFDGLKTNPFPPFLFPLKEFSLFGA